MHLQQIIKAHLVLLVIITCIFTMEGSSYAQSYTVYPNDTIRMIGTMEDFQTLSIEQRNTTNDTLHLKWKKISEDVPNFWEASICDNRFCHTILADSGNMNPVVKGDYGFVLLHITAHVNYGTATIRYAVWDAQNPLLIDTLTYVLEVKNTNGIMVQNSQHNFYFAPNPASEFIKFRTLESANFKFQISDINGHIFYSGLSESAEINVSVLSFPNGIYFISILKDNSIINSKKLVVHH